MNILICLKQVPDTSIRIQLSKDNTGIDTSNIEWIINPYDEFALEEALRIKESSPDTKIIALSMGPPRVEKSLRTALAIGADKAYFIEAEKPENSQQVSQALCAVIKQENIDLILMGKLGIDENNSATGPMLAEQLQIPHVGFVTKLTKNTDNTWTCERQIEEGIKEEISLRLPALLTTEKGINTPRYPSLVGIIQAKNKVLKKITLSSLNLTKPIPSFCFNSYSLPKTTFSNQLITGSPLEQSKKLIQILKDKKISL